MAVYSSVEEYLAAVEAKLPDAITKYLAPEVEEILREFTMSNVYGHYTPKQGAWIDGSTYHATRSLLGGISSWTEGNTLYATSFAAPNASIAGGTVYGGSDGGFYTLLESSNMGIWKSGFPRPVIGPAQSYIDSHSNVLVDKLVKGLESML